MNDIRFRLIKDGQIVGYERHIIKYGEIKIQHKLLGNKHSWHDIRFEPARFIHHDAKEIFTGLRDKNGDEIYEGDIWSGGYYLERYIVEWDEEYTGFEPFTAPGCGGYEWENERSINGEVIGTIHDTGK